ncbi:Predicted nucleotide-binding protein containing TIR-like domain-containing protein [Singulisphaera sp. GP187]|uniref:TIR domain-containing protein n=1 Tax=Singulisphaera sp. GP187 TaxID=1882752 RepID=UPI00092A0AE5|nr:TIR domain-containing protein [Singulisphaera sp. GP187]SIO57885.1 Predicted nucleotide-binding protein containing TIR-like domain-containing protein [Singulisphaera sp. GP187]
MKPSVFVGSSAEGLRIAYAIQQNLDYDAEVTVWNQGVFELSSFTLPDLLSCLYTVDFSVFVLAPDDVVKIRGKESSAVRDNVIFELGLFIGRLGRDRTFLVSPRGQTDFHLPTDLLGLLPATFIPDRIDGNLLAALGPACNAIRDRIKVVGLVPRAPSKVRTISGPTLLVADDDMKAGDLAFNEIKQIIGGRCELLLVSDPTEACELLNSGAPVIGCVADMVFRAYSPLAGVQIAATANRNKVPVIIVTGHRRKDLGLALAELRRVGIPESCVFSKPVTVEQNPSFWNSIGVWINGRLS